jgi:alcohol dehydrogenase
LSGEPERFVLQYYDVKLFFGRKILREIKPFIQEYKRFGILTGRSSAKISGAYDDVINLLREFDAEYIVYDKISPNPWVSEAEKAGEMLWREGVEAVIAIGGGSVIDAAKVASVIASGGGGFKDVFRGHRPRNMMPLIAINLTHGTGTEIDRYAVLTTDDTREKHGLDIRYPTISVDDPIYTISLPKDHTIYTSLDAFYHAYEAATSNYRNIFVETLSREAIFIIRENLPVLLKDLSDIERRAMLLYASMIAGIAIDQSSTHLNHAIEHVLSGLEPRLPHGLGLALTGPRVVYYTHKVRPIESARILRTLDPNIKPLEEDAEKAMRIVKEFQESLGVTQRLEDYGFSENDFKKIYSYLTERLRYLYEDSTPFQISEDIIRDIISYAL